jgi:hypothetical protein
MKAARGGSVLRLHDLIKKRVDGGGRDVGGVSAIGTELIHEGGIVDLLDD